LAFISDRYPHFPQAEIYIMKFEPEGPDNEPIRVTYHTEEGYCWNLLWSPAEDRLLYTYGPIALTDDTLYEINPWEGMESQEIITIAGGYDVFPTDR